MPDPTDQRWKVKYGDIEKDAKYYCNQILCHREDKKRSYYIPVRTRLKFKMFKEINLQELYAVMDGTLLLSVFYGGAPQHIIDQLRHSIVVNFNLDDPVKLADYYGGMVNVQENQQTCEINYTYRGSFRMRVTSDVYQSPFEIINLVLTVNPLAIKLYQDQLNDKNQRDSYVVKECIRFNLMDCEQKYKFTKVSFSEMGKFGNYDLAQKKIRVEYTNDSTPSQIHKEIISILESGVSQNTIKQNEKEKEKEKENKQLKQYEYAHFTLPVYKFALPTMTTIFLPLLLLSLVNLCIFFQENQLSSRIGSIGAVLVAFVALIPNVREQIPPSDKITFVQKLVFGQAFVSILCLVQSMIGIYFHPILSNIIGILIFLVSLGITVYSTTVVVNKFIKNRDDILQHYNQKGAGQQKKLHRKQWYNIQCSKDFWDSRDKIVPINLIRGYGDKKRFEKKVQKKVQKKAQQKPQQKPQKSQLMHQAQQPKQKILRREMTEEIMPQQQKKIQ